MTRIKLTVVVTEETYRKLIERMRKENFINLSEFLRHIIRKYLESS